MTLLLTLIKDLLNPGRNWGEFTRKIISLLAFSSVAMVGVHEYYHWVERTDKYIPVAERIDKRPQAKEEVKRIMSDLLYRHPQIRSVWIYSWPDSANLDVVHRVGDPVDPIPTGHFWTTDVVDIGKLTLNICTELQHGFPNTACSLVGAGDTWGLLVVVWHADQPKPDGHMALVAGIAGRISHLLYK